MENYPIHSDDHRAQGYQALPATQDASGHRKALTTAKAGHRGEQPPEAKSPPQSSEAKKKRRRSLAESTVVTLSPSQAQVRLTIPLLLYQFQTSKEQLVKWQLHLFQLLTGGHITKSMKIKEGEREDLIPPWKARLIVNFFAQLMDLDGLTSVQLLIDQYNQDRFLIAQDFNTEELPLEDYSIPEAIPLLTALLRLTSFESKCEVGEKLKQFLLNYLRFRLSKEYVRFLALVNPKSSTFSPIVHAKIKQKGFHTLPGISWSSVVVMYMIQEGSAIGIVPSRYDLKTTISTNLPMAQLTGGFSSGFLSILPLSASSQWVIRSQSVAI